MSTGENIGHDYDRWTDEALSPERISELTLDLIPDAETRAGRTMGLHIVDGTTPQSDIGRYVEWKVFDKVFKNDLATMKNEYEPYDSTSTFLLVIDYEKQQPAAVLRIIRPGGPNGLKSMNDLVAPAWESDGNSMPNPWYKAGDSVESRLKEIGNDGSQTVDIGTMAVMPEYRSAHARTGASAALYSSCIRWSFENDYPYWVTIIDKRAISMIQAWGEPFESFDHADFYASYLDSPESIPMHLELYSRVSQIRDYDARNGTDVFGLYTKGTGLENQFVLPEFTLPDIG